MTRRVFFIAPTQLQSCTLVRQQSDGQRCRADLAPALDDTSNHCASADAGRLLAKRANNSRPVL